MVSTFFLLISHTKKILSNDLPNEVFKHRAVVTYCVHYKREPENRKKLDFT